MNTRSLLLYVPGYPLTSANLMPQRALAIGAGRLLETGHWTRVLDYGTVRSMASHGDPPASERARRPGSRLRSPSRRGIRAPADRRIDAIIEAVAAASPLDFIVFLVHERSDLIGTRTAAERLRAFHPEMKQLIAGRYVDAFAPILLSQCGVFDCAVVGGIEIGLTAFAGCAGHPERWPRLPGLITRDGGNGYARLRPSWAVGDHFTAPCYDADIYPAAHSGDKFKVFPIEHGDGLEPLVSAAGHARPDTPWSPRRVPPRSARSVCLEMARLASEYRAGAFHITGTGTQADAVCGLAYELLSRAMPVRYSRSGGLPGADASVAGVLASSGCEALGFRVDTGSQRLLDDFYGYDFTVSQIERAYRAIRRTGIFSAVHLTYPCPWDDEHTFVETLRLLTRTRPHAASVSAPAPAPGSMWFQRARDFGFVFNHKRYLRWVRGETSGKKSAYRMRGWPRSSARAARRELLARIAAFDIAPEAHAHEGLMARLAGFTGNEATFIRALHQGLAGADAERVGLLMEQVNAGAALPKHKALFPAFDPVLAAVGN